MSANPTAAAVRGEVDADGVCTLIMDLPGRPMNVIGSELMRALRAAVARAVADERVRGIILASGKPAFVAGADLKEIDSDGRSASSRAAGVDRLEAVMALSRELRGLETCGKPVACAVNGTALGGGFEIALACHYRVVVDDPKAVLGLPEANVGLLPGGGGTQRLIRLLGIRRALPMMLQGATMSPAEALAAGLVHAVVPADRLLAEAKRLLLDEGDPVAPWDKKGFAIPGGGSQDPAVRNVFGATNAMLRASSFGNLPAPAAITAAVYEGGLLPMDLALRVEGKYFLRLMESPTSKALIRTMFVNKGKADKLHARPQHVAKARYGRIGVLGAGTMGAGLALTAARAGIEVVLLDRDQSIAEAGREYAARRLARDVEKGRRTREKADAALARITPTRSYDDLADMPLVIEAVFEDRAVKRDVIARCDAMLPPDAVIASNTSAIPITELAGYSSRPERFIGMHFFAPVERMALVEIIRGRTTSDETLARALDLAEALRKTPIVVNDGPGFFTSRFIGSFIGVGLEMITRGVNPNLVENGARMLGMPMGVMAVCDSTGLDLHHHARRRSADGGPTETELDVIGVLVTKHGRHGRSCGKGFYDYAADGSRSLWPGLAEVLPRPAEQPSIAEVKQRLLYAQLVEGARCFADGVLTSVADGDLGAVLGVGFPAYLGGPFLAMDAIGLPRFVAEADRLAEAYGERYYAVPPSVRQMAAGGRFHGPGAASVPSPAGAASAAPPGI